MTLFTIIGDFIALFHYPIQVWDRRHFDSLHFYGHIHSNPIEFNIKNSYNVCIDILGEPMTKDEILAFYDKHII